MQPPEITKILNEWVDALKNDDFRGRKRVSLGDLVKKYAEDDSLEKGESPSNMALTSSKTIMTSDILSYSR